MCLTERSSLLPPTALKPNQPLNTGIMAALSCFNRSLLAIFVHDLDDPLSSDMYKVEKSHALNKVLMAVFSARASYKLFATKIAFIFIQLLGRSKRIGLSE